MPSRLTGREFADIIHRVENPFDPMPAGARMDLQRLISGLRYQALELVEANRTKNEALLTLVALVQQAGGVVDLPVAALHAVSANDKLRLETVDGAPEPTKRLTVVPAPPHG